MARKPKEQRNEEQRVRQSELRARKRAECRADRDDMARTLLWLMIRAAQRDPNPRKALGGLRDAIVTELEKQGFHVKYAEDDFEALAAKYARSLEPFLKKRHFGPTSDDVPTDPASGSSS